MPACGPPAAARHVAGRRLRRDAAALQRVAVAGAVDWCTVVRCRTRYMWTRMWGTSPHFGCSWSSHKRHKRHNRILVRCAICTHAGFVNLWQLISLIAVHTHTQLYSGRLCDPGGCYIERVEVICTSESPQLGWTFTFRSWLGNAACALNTECTHQSSSAETTSTKGSVGRQSRGARHLEEARHSPTLPTLWEMTRVPDPLAWEPWLMQV